MQASIRYDSAVPEPSTLLLILTGTATGLVGSLRGLGGVFLVPLLTLAILGVLGSSPYTAARFAGAL